MARRLTIVVEIHDDDPGARDRANDAAAAVIDGAQPHQLVDAQWDDPPASPTPTAATPFVTARAGWDSCAHCHAEGRPCWVHAQ